MHWTPANLEGTEQRKWLDTHISTQWRKLFWVLINPKRLWNELPSLQDTCTTAGTKKSCSCPSSDTRQSKGDADKMSASFWLEGWRDAAPPTMDRGPRQAKPAGDMASTTLGILPFEQGLIRTLKVRDLKQQNHPSHHQTWWQEQHRTW